MKNGLYSRTFRFARGTTGRELVWRCAAVRRALWAYIDSELAPDARRDVGVHLAVCAECALAYEERRALTRVLRERAPVLLSASARARILSRVAQGRSVPSVAPIAIARPAPGK